MVRTGLTSQPLHHLDQIFYCNSASTDPWLSTAHLLLRFSFSTRSLRSMDASTLSTKILFDAPVHAFSHEKADEPLMWHEAESPRLPRPSSLTPTISKKPQRSRSTLP